MPEKLVLRPKQRDQLFTKLRTDAKFRELVKQDWRKALESTGMKPEAVAKGMLSRSEIESFAGQRASWTIEIVIAGRTAGLETIELKDAVTFEAR